MGFSSVAAWATASHLKEGQTLVLTRENQEQSLWEVETAINQLFSSVINGGSPVSLY